MRLKRNMKEIPLNAMLNIDAAMQRAMQQLQAIQEQQRAIDLLYTMQEQTTTPSHHTSVPLHVMAKMDRAVGFGLHAKSSILLLDGRNQIMAKLSYVMNESSELSQAFLKMSEDDAMEFDARVTEFLRAKTEEMRRRRAGGGRGGNGGGGGGGRNGGQMVMPRPSNGANGNGSYHPPNGRANGNGNGGRAQTQVIPRTKVDS